MVISSFKNLNPPPPSPGPKNHMLKEVGFTHAGLSFRERKKTHHTLQSLRHLSSQHVSKVRKHIDLKQLHLHIHSNWLKPSVPPTLTPMSLSDAQNCPCMYFSIHCTYTVLPFPAAFSSSLQLHPTSIIITTAPSRNRKPFAALLTLRIYVKSMFSILQASFIVPTTNLSFFRLVWQRTQTHRPYGPSMCVCIHAYVRQSFSSCCVRSARSGFSCTMNERYGVNDLVGF